MKTRKQYTDNIVVGNIVAFKNSDAMYSAKVISVVGEELTVQTPNGSIFYIEKASVVWVKNGTHWPEGVYNALKYTKKASERTEPAS